LRHIHHYLFQDVYVWAGEFRTVPIAKGNSFFARPEHIQAELQKLFHQLAGEQFLRGIDSSGFCRRAAHYLGEINALHPFLEGNGRAQREFIRELAAEAGYEIAWDLVTQDEMFAASVASFHRGSSDSFATILNKIGQVLVQTRRGIESRWPTDLRLAILSAAFLRTTAYGEASRNFPLPNQEVSVRIVNP
jgi:fido (protein-threonine AMPylation protein)